MAGEKFTDFKDRINEGLINRLGSVPFPGETEGFTLIDGFFNTPIYDELMDGLLIGAPTVPMIAILGNKTGRMYFFALKAIVPDFDSEPKTND